MPEISASLGVAIFPDCGDDAADLLRLSALALEKARNTGSSGQIVISSAC
jgi:predicted signal transduction protein with EAL and GGDEF domain